MQIQTDRALLPAHADATRFLTVTITAPGAPRRAERPPVNVALVLDRSGSMHGQKFEMARTAVAHAIRLLDARDRLAVVVYDDEVEVVLESASATPETKTLALKKLAAIEPRGSTDLGAGLARGGSAVAMRALEENRGERSRVLLLTDGLANRGVTDPGELGDMVSEWREHGIVTTTFGLGADFDETLLSRLATAGGGHFYFVETPRQIPDFFTSELGEALEVVAPDAELIVRVGPGVRLDVFHDLRVERRDDEVRVALGDLVSDQEITVGIALHWEARAIGAPAFADIRVADRAGALFPQPMRVEWTTVAADQDARQPVNSSVLIAVAQLIAARAAAAALAANRVAFYSEAEQMLKDAASKLRAMAGGVAEVAALADRLDDEVALHSEAMSPMAMKARHYASYTASRSRDASGKAKRVMSDRS